MTTIPITSVLSQQKQLPQLLVSGIHTPTHMHTHVQSQEIDCHTQPTGKQSVNIFSMAVCACLSIAVQTNLVQYHHCEGFLVGRSSHLMWFQGLG